MDLLKLLPRGRGAWRRATCRALVALVLLTIAGDAVLEGWIASVDLPDAPLRPQASVLFHRDGRTVLARVGVTDHNDVALDAVPAGVRRAVIAAEDRDFYGHWGVSVRGVFRAAVADAGGDRQGASTITQQYVRNAYLTQQVTAGRKAREFALAVKLERTVSKDEILTRYLNTIYFGRGAYGIAAAAHAYFGVPVERLDAAQGAVLAAVIKDPSYFDPAVNPAEALDRWQWIVAGMGATGRLSYPAVLPADAGTAGGDPGGTAGNGLVVDQVERELARTASPRSSCTPAACPSSPPSTPPPSAPPSTSSARPCGASRTGCGPRSSPSTRPAAPSARTTAAVRAAATSTTRPRRTRRRRRSNRSRSPPGSAKASATCRAGTAARRGCSPTGAAPRSTTATACSAPTAPWRRRWSGP